MIKTFCYCFCIFLPLLFSAQSEEKIIIGVTHSLESKILNEKRILNIYLPEGYTKNDTTHYSVIYLLDGGTDEDLIHISGLVQFNTFPWVNRLRPTIVVGIANTDRKKDLTFPTTIAGDKEKYKTAGHSADFISFIEKELQPYIESSYKTNGVKTLIGQSLGGLLAAEILLKKPSLFNRYIIVSPSLWWDNASLLKQSATALNSIAKTSVYIGVGKEGKGLGITNRTMEEEAKLLSEKIKAVKNPNITVYYDFLPEEDHATVLHPAVYSAFKWMSKLQ